MRNQILIEAGHSLFSPGAIAYNNLTEHHYNQEVQDMIVKKQQKAVALKGSSMIPITDNEELQLNTVINLINNTIGLSHGLSIHFNNNNIRASGTECFIHPNTSKANRDRAIEICDVTSRILGIPNRGIKYPAQSALGSLGIIERTRIPIILWEVCFLNRNDMEKYEANKQTLTYEIRQLLFDKKF